MIIDDRDLPTDPHERAMFLYDQATSSMRKNFDKDSKFLADADDIILAIASYSMSGLIATVALLGADVDNFIHDARWRADVYMRNEYGPNVKS